MGTPDRPLTPEERERFNAMARRLHRERKKWHKERWRTSVRMAAQGIAAMLMGVVANEYNHWDVILLGFLVWGLLITDVSRTLTRRHKAKWDDIEARTDDLDSGL